MLRVFFLISASIAWYSATYYGWTYMLTALLFWHVVILRVIPKVLWDLDLVDNVGSSIICALDGTARNRPYGAVGLLLGTKMTEEEFETWVKEKC